MKKILYKLKQFVCFHDWNRVHGWYDEPIRGATCLKCGKVNE